MIGLVVWSWAMMEEFLRYQLIRLSIAPRKPLTKDVIPPYILVSGMKARTVLGLLRSFVLRQFPDDLTEFDKIRKRIERLSDTRDLIVHSAWERGTKPNSISTLRTKTINQIKSESHEFTCDELCDLGARIQEEAKTLWKFFSAHGLAFNFAE